MGAVGPTLELLTKNGAVKKAADVATCSSGRILAQPMTPTGDRGDQSLFRHTVLSLIDATRLVTLLVNQSVEIYAGRMQRGNRERVIPLDVWHSFRS